MTIRVRELPPLRLHVRATTPTGRNYRWGPDEPNPANVPSGLSSSSTMPGGFENLDGALPRKAGIDYDLDRLTTLRLLGPGGDVAWDGRLERAPRTSGDQFVINPSAVGWQAHLADDNSASFIGLDRDISTWQAASRQRQVNLLSSTYNMLSDPTTIPDATTGAPTLQTGFSGAWTTGALPVSEAWYDAGDGGLIGRLRATWTRGANVSNTNTDWSWKAFVSDDDIATTVDATSELRAAGPGTVDLAAAGDRRFAALQFLNDLTPSGGDGFLWAINWTNVRVIGDHGLTIHGDTAATEGLLSSDLEAYAVGKWAPRLTFTTGSDGTIRPSAYVIPHIAFKDRTNTGEIIKQAVRFELRDWAVWENLTYYSAARGTFGRKWRARITPAQLEETGPQIDQLWNGVIVIYRDVDGSTRTVGPTGSGSGTEDSSLLDSDPANPANELGIRRWTTLQAGTLTAAAAVVLGAKFLEQQKLLDTSGKATIVGHIEDDKGVIHPYWRVRAGDQIRFVDATDTSYRRIVSVQHDHDARTASLDLDSPPDGMSALLERLGVAVVGLGLS